MKHISRQRGVKIVRRRGPQTELSAIKLIHVGNQMTKYGGSRDLTTALKLIS